MNLPPLPGLKWECLCSKCGKYWLADEKPPAPACVCGYMPHVMRCDKYTAEQVRQAVREALAAAVPEMKEALCVAICGLFITDPQDVTNTFTVAELEQVLDITENLKPESVEGVYRKAWDFLAAAQEVKP